MKAKKLPVIEIFPGTKRRGPGFNGPAWFWRLKAPNGKVVADGAEAYTSESNAKRAAVRAIGLCGSATITRHATVRPMK